MNSKWHLYISVLKSLLRIFGCIAVIVKTDIMFFSISFIAAEVLGILEELGDKR